MIAVADASPICYLVLIGQVDLLPQLFTEVILPRAVLDELLHVDAPAPVRVWGSSLPPWVVVAGTPRGDLSGLEHLQAGERAAILLAASTNADLILLDEKAARQAAVRRACALLDCSAL